MYKKISSIITGFMEMTSMYTSHSLPYFLMAIDFAVFNHIFVYWDVYILLRFITITTGVFFLISAYKYHRFHKFIIDQDDVKNLKKVHSSFELLYAPRFLIPLESIIISFLLISLLENIYNPEVFFEILDKLNKRFIEVQRFFINLFIVYGIFGFVSGVPAFILYKYQNTKKIKLWTKIILIPVFIAFVIVWIIACGMILGSQAHIEMFKLIEKIDFIWLNGAILILIIYDIINGNYFDKYE